VELGRRRAELKLRIWIERWNEPENSGVKPKRGGIVSVTYVSGTVSANSPVRPVVSATGSDFHFPVRRFGKDYFRPSTQLRRRIRRDSR